ncbi:hypothetical protein M0R72_15510 [Candidatus Pacearchaeota archaeon]|jgi:hypothetical protein|nr:hypothetical protein [Candidatus Pacearchaeota archaeon]
MTFQQRYKAALIRANRRGYFRPEEFKTLIDACEKPVRQTTKGEKIDLMHEVEKYSRKRGWPEIWSWIKENWLAILKLILSLLPLFLSIETQPT